MPKRKSTGGRTTVDKGFVKSLSHELRVQIMAILTERTASPNELSKALDEELGGVSYHVNVLKEYGRIELVRTEPRRGAVEHFYRATSKSLLPAKTWRGLKKNVRTMFGGGLASDLFNDLAEALKGGKLAKSDSHICRMPLVLDAEGWKNVTAYAEQFTAEVEDEQRASLSRATKANGSGGGVKGYTVGLLAFEDSRDFIANGPLGKATKPAARNGKGAKANPKGGKRKARTGDK